MEDGTFTTQLKKSSRIEHDLTKAIHWSLNFSNWDTDSPAANKLLPIPDNGNVHTVNEALAVAINRTEPLIAGEC